MKMKKIILSALMIVPGGIRAMDEPEVCNCEIFNVAGQLLKELVISIRFKCGQPSPSDRLFEAIGNNNLTEVATLLQKNPQLADNAEDSEGKTPLLAATLLGNSSIVAQILYRQPQVDRVTHQGHALNPVPGIQWLSLAGLTPLMVAAKLNHLDIAKQLISAGAKKELQDFSRPAKTALDYAREKPHIQMINLLS